MTPVLTTVLVSILLISSCSADNIALNKSAYQIGKWGGGVAERAVDGQYDVDYGTQDYYLTVCARPDTAWRGHVPAVWWVDLEDVYNISTITVYNTYDMEGYQKLSNFTVDVVKSDNRTRQRCGVYNGSEPVSRGGSFTFNCDNLSGRYVYVRKLTGKDQTNIPLCEVEVYGVLAKGSTTALQPSVTTSSQDTTTTTSTTTTRKTTVMMETPVHTTTTATTTTTTMTELTAEMPQPSLSPSQAPTTLTTPETTAELTSTTTVTTTSQTPTAIKPTTTSQTTSLTTETITSSPTISQNRTTLGPLIDISLRNKPTNQTGAFGGLTSDKAVDGLLYNTGGDDDDNAHCAHPLNQEGQPAEWWIDLEEMYKIHSITLYNTGNAGGDFRMADFAIRVYNPRVQSYVTCAEYPETVGPAANITLTCGHNVYGEYVQFIRLGGREINKVTICEVEIKGQKYSGCPLGYYGDQCNQLCGMCSNEDPDIYNPCDVTGSCINGCQMWWITEICKTEIVKPHYDGQQISLSMSTSDQIDIFLQQVDVPSNISQYYGYNITYDNDESLLVNHDHGKTTIIVSLTGLSYNAEYSVKVQPYRVMTGRYDYGSTYPEKMFKTKCAAPDPPTFSPNPRNSSLDADRFEITVNYEVPKEIRCDSLTRLQVSYHSDGNSTWTSVDADLNLDTLSIASLDPGTYFIKMTATNNEGLWGESNTKSVEIKAPFAASKPDTSNIATTGSAVVVSLLVITAVVIAVVLLYMRKFKKNKESRKMDEANNTSSPGPVMPSNGDTLDGIIVDKSSEAATNGVSYKEENPYINTVICISDFEDYVKMKNTNSSNDFDEYKSLPSIDHGRYKIAITDDNKKKNRYLNIYPYDDNRVILEEEYSNTGGDYINASFIKGYGNTEKAYIAAQGVKPETVHHFWKMIWQYNINRIVMLSNLVEENKRKCHQYWPKTTGEPEHHEEYSVTCDSETEFADFVVRVLLLTKGDESRQIYHFHFTSWKDKSRPMLGPFTLASFYRKVRSVDNEATGPLVVHCSAGVGRTGTFIAYDILLQQKAQERVVDIYGCIQKLRQQRMLMVQTKDQYIFLHDAVLEAILIGETTYPCSTLSEEVKGIYEDNGNGESELERQFMLLGKLKIKQSNTLKEGLLEENKHKNRAPDVVPDECDRPYLSTPVAGSNHYINAVYVDSFSKHRHYVVTQMPLPDTEVDFWRLVYDQRLKCVVMLNELDETCKQYWPDEGSAEYGPIKVQLLASAKISPNIAMREFVLDLAEDNSTKTSSKPLNVRHYHLLNWPNTDILPPDIADFLSLMEEIHTWKKHQKHSHGPNENDRILIHCLDGVTRSGMFCGASHAIEQIKMNNEVDVFLAARYVSLGRQQFFQTVEEYKFLYDIAVEYLARYNQYVNFSGAT